MESKPSYFDFNTLWETGALIPKRQHPQLRFTNSTTQEDTDDRSGAYCKQSLPHILPILEHNVTHRSSIITVSKYLLSSY